MSLHFDAKDTSRRIDNLRDTRSLYNGIRFVFSYSRALYSFKLEVVKAVTGQTTKRTTNILVVEVTQVFFLCPRFRFNIPVYIYYGVHRECVIPYTHFAAYE